MYLSYYGLSRPPFETAPEPEPFFESPGHLDALSGLIYAITENRGFISITGEPGVGKTTTLYAAVQSLGLTHPSLIWIEFADPEVTTEGFLAVVVDRLNLPSALTVGGDLTPIRNRLLRQRDSGKSLILVFDAAERLSGEMLAFLERLADLDGDETPLFLIVFIGRPAWASVLSRGEHQGLDRRIAVRAMIPPLSRPLARSYIAFRLAAAGGMADSIMAGSAVRTIAALARGNPGRIHRLADQALGVGLANRRHPITAADVRAALPTFEPVPIGRRVATYLPPFWILFGIAIITMFAIAWLAVHAMTPPLIPSKPAPPMLTPLSPLLATPATRSVSAKPPATVAGPVRPAPLAPVTAIIRPSTSEPKPPAPAPVPNPLAIPASPATVAIKVRPGDTIMMILSRSHLPASIGELKILRNLNPDLGNGNLIHPGQSIVLPKAAP